MRKLLALLLCAALCLSLASCASAGNGGAEEGDAAADVTETEQPQETEDETGSSAVITKDDIDISQALETSGDGEHVIVADGESLSYSNTAVNKTGESSGDEADFYGVNSAVFATDGGTLELSQMVITTDGTHANAVFSYGSGTTVRIKDSVIETSGNCSGGLMTTGGGTMLAEGLNIHTTGNSSAAIRSDRGGGTVNVTGGSYITDGKGSPSIYSTAEITVSDAYLESTSSQGVVVEGKNSVTLNDVELVADNNSKNSDKSPWYQAVMIYQSMSGDAAEGTSSFSMNGGSLTNRNGDVFFVNNTVTRIDLNGADIVNEDEEGVFLRAAAAGWGREGSNGGQVTLTAGTQKINGDILVDDVSNLNLILKDSSVFDGAVNPDGLQGDVYVEIDGSSVWRLTSDSFITGLTCRAGAVDLNGHKLYINGTVYDGGESQGELIEPVVTSGGGHGDAPPDGGPGGNPPEGGPGGPPPDGKRPG